MARHTAVSSLPPAMSRTMDPHTAVSSLTPAGSVMSPLPSAPSSFSAQKLVGYTVAAVAAALVLYPVFFLVQAALDTGDPQARPPTAYGLDNFASLFQYAHILLNTLTVSLGATAMALLFGFVTA